MALRAKSEKRQSISSDEGSAGAQHNKSSRVSFSATPAAVFDTYSSKEYERKDGETDPLTASVVFHLEKLVESLDSFNVTLNKGDSGLGFSIIGMGFGDNLGPEDRLSICIKQILDQGTAQKDGRIHPGDQIIEVNGKSMVGVTYQEAVNILKGATGKVSLRMGRRKLDGSSPEGLFPMGVLPTPAIGHPSDVHKLTTEVAMKSPMTAHATLQGSSTTIGGHSGQINTDHRITDEVDKKVTLTTHTTLQGSSTTIGGHSGQINDDHRLSIDLAKKTPVTAHATLHGSSSTTIGGHSGQINSDHRITDEVVKKSSTTTHAHTRRDSSSDDEEARKRQSSDFHGIDDLQGNSKALMLKLELASIKRQELERQLEVIRAEIDGVLRQRSSDGKSHGGEMSDRLKLIEVEATLLKAKRETDRMKGLRDDSDRQIEELDKRLRSEIRLMHETHSSSLKVIEQCRSKEQEHDAEKETIKRRLCDMDQQYERQIHTLTEKIRHLEVRFSGSYDEIDITHVTSPVTPGIALAVNHANDRSPKKEITHPSFSHTLSDKSVAIVKTGGHSSDSDSEDGRRRKLMTTKTDSVISVHRPAGKSTETSSSMTAIVKTTRHSDSDTDVVLHDAPPDYAPPPIPDDDSSDSDKVTPTVLQVNRNEIVDDRHRLEIGVAVGATVAGHRLLEKRISNEGEVSWSSKSSGKRHTDGHGLLNGSNVHRNKLEHGSSSDEGGHSRTVIQLEIDKQLKKPQEKRLREQESSDEERKKKASKSLERGHSPDELKTSIKIERVENSDSLRRSNSSEKKQKAGLDAHSSDDERQKKVLDVGVQLDGRRLSVERRHSGTSDRNSETGESPVLGGKLQSHQGPGLAVALDKQGEISSEDGSKQSASKKNKKGFFKSKSKDSDGIAYPAMGLAVAVDKHEDISSEDESKQSASKKNKKSFFKSKSKDSDGIAYPAMGLAVAVNKQGETSSEDEFNHSASKKNETVLSKGNDSIAYPIIGGAIALKKHGDISSDEEFNHSASKKNETVLSKGNDGVAFPVMGGAIALKKDGDISSDEEFNHSASKKNETVLPKGNDGIAYPVMGGAIALKNQGEISSEDETKNTASKKNKKGFFKSKSKDRDGIAYPAMGLAVAVDKQGEISSEDESKPSASKKNKKGFFKSKSKDSDGIAYPAMGLAVALDKQGDISSDDESKQSASKKNEKALSKSNDGISYPVMGGAIALKKQGDVSSEDETKNSASKKNKKLLSKDGDGIIFPVMGAAVALEKGEISSEDEVDHSGSKKNKKVLPKDNDGIALPAMGIAVGLDKHGDISSSEEFNHSDSKKMKRLFSRDSDGISYPVVAASASGNRGELSSEEEEFKHSSLKKNNDGITYPVIGLAVGLEKRGDTATTSNASAARLDVEMASRVNKQRNSDEASLGSRSSSSFKDHGEESHGHSRLKGSHKEVHKTLEASFRPWKSTPDVSGNREMMMSLSNYPSSGGRLADQWSIEEVTDWLISISLGELVGVFERHDVDGKKLLALSNNSFKEMDIGGKNKDLLKKKIKELQSAIAREKKHREKEEKLREKEEKARAKLQKKEASKNKTGKKHRGPDETSLGSRASSDDEDHSRPTSSHLEGQSPVGTGVRPWKSTSDVSSGLMMSSFSSYPSSSGQVEYNGHLADQWSTEEVASWLISISLGELVVVFGRHDVDGKKLLALSNNSFKDMDIEGKNKDVLKKKIKELQSAIAKEKKLREKEEKLREKEEKAQAKHRKKEAAKNK